METIHLSPVQCATLAFGSQIAVAKAANVKGSTVSHWKADVEKDGNGGAIPDTTRIRQLLLAARSQGIPLTAEDLVLGRDVMKD